MEGRVGAMPLKRGRHAPKGVGAMPPGVGAMPLERGHYAPKAWAPCP
jgi:hypothetical protein